MRDIVFAICENVRRWAEQTAKQLGHTSDLCGMCAIASARLHIELNEVGIKSDICMSKTTLGDHCFLIVDNHVVDVTATQFDEYYCQDVVVRKVSKKLIRRNRFWRPTNIFKTVSELVSFQTEKKWPQSQMVNL